MRNLAIAGLALLALAGCKTSKPLPRAAFDAKALLTRPFPGYTATVMGGSTIEGATSAYAARLQAEGDASRAGMAMVEVVPGTMPNKADANGIPRFGGPPIANAANVRASTVDGVKVFLGSVEGAPMPNAKAAAWFQPFVNGRAIVYAADEKTAEQLAKALLDAWTQG